MTGDLGELASTTVLLLLLVFGLVNISVLVLRRSRRAPALPERRRGRRCSARNRLARAGQPVARRREPRVYLLALILVGSGAVLWASSA